MKKIIIILILIFIAIGCINNENEIHSLKLSSDTNKIINNEIDKVKLGLAALDNYGNKVEVKDVIYFFKEKDDKEVQKLKSNYFSSEKVGEFIIYAKYKNIKSNEIIVIVKYEEIKKIEIEYSIEKNADKNYIIKLSSKSFNKNNQEIKIDNDYIQIVENKKVSIESNEVEFLPGNSYKFQAVNGEIESEIISVVEDFILIHEENDLLNDDSSIDGNLAYNTNENYKKGDFDIYGLEIKEFKDKYYFEIEIKNNFENLLKRESGWDYQIFDIYIKLSNGKNKISLKDRNLYFENGWDKAILVSPFSNENLEIERELNSKNEIEGFESENIEKDIIISKDHKIISNKIIFSVEKKLDFNLDSFKEINMFSFCSTNDFNFQNSVMRVYSGFKESKLFYDSSPNSNSNYIDMLGINNILSTKKEVKNNYYGYIKIKNDGSEEELVVDIDVFESYDIKSFSLQNRIFYKKNNIIEEISKDIEIEVTDGNKVKIDDYKPRIGLNNVSFNYNGLESENYRFEIYEPIISKIEIVNQLDDIIYGYNSNFEVDAKCYDQKNKEINFDNFTIYINEKKQENLEFIAEKAGVYKLKIEVDEAISKIYDVVVKDFEINRIQLNIRNDFDILKDEKIDIEIKGIINNELYKEIDLDDCVIYVNYEEKTDLSFIENTPGEYSIVVEYKGSRSNNKILKSYFPEMDKIYLEIEQEIIYNPEIKELDYKVYSENKYGSKYLIKNHFDYKLYLNETIVEDKKIMFDSMGVYKVKVEFNGIESEELEVKVDEEKIKEVKVYANQNIYYLNDLENIRFDVVVLNQKNEEMKSDYKIYLNDQEFNDNFEFKPGKYNYYAKSGDIISITKKIEVYKNTNYESIKNVMELKNETDINIINVNENYIYSLEDNKIIKYRYENDFIKEKEFEINKPNVYLKNWVYINGNIVYIFERDNIFLYDLENEFKEIATFSVDFQIKQLKVFDNNLYVFDGDNNIFCYSINKNNEIEYLTKYELNLMNKDKSHYIENNNYIKHSEGVLYIKNLSNNSEEYFIIDIKNIDKVKVMNSEIILFESKSYWFYDKKNEISVSKISNKKLVSIDSSGLIEDRLNEVYILGDTFLIDVFNKIKICKIEENKLVSKKEIKLDGDNEKVIIFEDSIFVKSDFSLKEVEFGNEILNYSNKINKGRFDFVEKVNDENIFIKESNKIIKKIDNIIEDIEDIYVVDETYLVRQSYDNYKLYDLNFTVLNDLPLFGYRKYNFCNRLIFNEKYSGGKLYFLSFDNEIEERLSGELDDKEIYITNNSDYVFGSNFQEFTIYRKNDLSNIEIVKHEKNLENKKIVNYSIGHIFIEEQYKTLLVKSIDEKIVKTLFVEEYDKSIVDVKLINNKLIVLFKDELKIIEFNQLEE